MSVFHQHSVFQPLIVEAQQAIANIAVEGSPYFALAYKDSRPLGEIPDLVFLACFTLVLRKRPVSPSDFAFLVKRSIILATSSSTVYSTAPLAFVVGAAVADLTQEDDLINA